MWHIRRVVYRLGFRPAGPGPNWSIFYSPSLALIYGVKDAWSGRKK